MGLAQRKPPTPNNHDAHVVRLSATTMGSEFTATVLSWMSKAGNLSQYQSELLKSQMDNPDSLRGLEMMVNITAWATRKRNRDYDRWRESAMRVCVRRGAHYQLLKKLFKAQKGEVEQLKQELRMPFSTRPKLVKAKDVAAIHRAWKDINQKMQNQPDYKEANSWINLANQFPEYSLNSLHSVVVGEAK
jgi:hypothetical protein